VGRRVAAAACEEPGAPRPGYTPHSLTLAARVAAPQERAQAPRAKASSFHRLLLRFDVLRRGFGKCHLLFREIDSDRNGVIDLKVLPARLAPMIGSPPVRVRWCARCTAAGNAVKTGRAKQSCGRRSCGRAWRAACFHVSDALLRTTFGAADMDNNHTIDFKVPRPA
jgi:hypothetical protein